MYKCKHFKIYELVDPTTYKNRGQRAWELLDERILIAIDKLREEFGSITINDWKWGGKFKWSGYRSPACKIGAKLSQHRFGRGMDLKFKHFTPQQIRKAMRESPSYFEEITCVENKTATWVHIDCRNTTRIKWINP